MNLGVEESRQHTTAAQRSAPPCERDYLRANGRARGFASCASGSETATGSESGCVWGSASSSRRRSRQRSRTHWAAATTHGEGDLEFPVPQVRDTAELFGSRVRPELTKHAAVLKRTARPWAKYPEFATRDRPERELVYLFASGICERLRAGERKEPVLRAWGICRDGWKVLLALTPGTKEDTESFRSFFQDLKRRVVLESLAIRHRRPRSRACCARTSSRTTSASCRRRSRAPRTTSKRASRS